MENINTRTQNIIITIKKEGKAKFLQSMLYFCVWFPGWLGNAQVQFQQLTLTVYDFEVKQLNREEGASSLVL